MKRPMNGITKKPTTASTRPATMDRRGTPASRRGRPGASTFTICAPPMSSVATASTAHPVAEPTASAHTAIAAHASSAPGSTGYDDPDDARGDRQTDDDESEVAHRSAVSGVMRARREVGEELADLVLRVHVPSVGCPAMEARAALVTGGSSGIGKALARVLGQEGYAVTISGRDAAKLAAAADELRGEGVVVEAVAVDLADERGDRRLVGQVDRDRLHDDALASQLVGRRRQLRRVAAADRHRVALLTEDTGQRLADATRPTRHECCSSLHGGAAYAWHVDTKHEIREFLTSRRARITPDMAER